MVQNKVKTARHAHPVAEEQAPTRSIVVRMGAPEHVGFTISQDSSLMEALSSGDIATRASSRASFTIVTAQL